MSINPYSICPGGTGKKIKFCCSDLLGELETIQRMIQADQRLGCLDHIAKLEATHPGRACLLTTKAMVQASLDQMDEAHQTLSGLLAEQPDNPVGLSQMALVEATREGARAGVQLLQKAVAASGTSFGSRVVEAFSSLGQMLLMEGHILAARGHLLMTIGLRPEDRTAMSLLSRLHASTEVPLLLKNDFHLASCPADAACHAEFEAAVEWAGRGQWGKAAEQFTALSEQAGELPAVWQNLAILRGWLADNDGTIAALRRLAACDVPLEDAVEAEALAQLLDPATQQDQVDRVRVVIEVDDFQQLAAALSADRRTAPLSPDQIEPGDDQRPPPRAAYWVLDRQQPETGVGIRLDEVPRILGRVLLFGRETDRRERLEVDAYRPDMAAITSTLTLIAGKCLGAAAETVLGRVSAGQLALSWSWRLPDDTPSEHIDELFVQQHRQALLEHWPETPSSLFGGRTPRQVADDPQQQVKLLAAILVLKVHQHDPAEDLLNELRGKLGLPLAAPIDPEQVKIDELPLVRLERVDAEKLSDSDLRRIYQRSMFMGAGGALRQFGLQIVARPSLRDKVDLAEVYGMLAALEDDRDKALGHLDQARTASKAAGKSCATWDLEELPLRMQRGEAEEFMQLLGHIQQEHLREPGVSQALVRLLSAVGLVGPDGRLIAPPGAETSESEIVVSGEAVAESGRIWTPDSQSPAGKKGGAIWTPDMG